MCQYIHFAECFTYANYLTMNFSLLSSFLLKGVDNGLGLEFDDLAKTCSNGIGLQSSCQRL